MSDSRNPAGRAEGRDKRPWTPESRAPVGPIVLAWWGTHYPHTFGVPSLIQAQQMAECMLDMMHGCAWNVPEAPGG